MGLLLRDSGIRHWFVILVSSFVIPTPPSRSYKIPQMKGGLWAYIKAAFNARPMGMFVAPNWVGLGAFALLGVLNPGFWAIGAGLELAYLFTLSSNKRFQRTVDAQHLQGAGDESAAKLRTLLNSLGPAERQRYQALEWRCRSILDQQHLGPGAVADLRLQGEGLGRLLWIYLRLLSSRQAFARLLLESQRVDAGGEPLEQKVRRIQRTLDEPPPESEELRRSLLSQVDILQQRLTTQREAADKLAYLDAELARIEQQVELIREQAVVSTDPGALSQRIDSIAAGLSGTNQWIRDQQQVYGQLEDVLEESPALVVEPAGGRVAQ